MFVHIPVWSLNKAGFYDCLQPRNFLSLLQMDQKSQSGVYGFKQHDYSLQKPLPFALAAAIPFLPPRDKPTKRSDNWQLLPLLFSSSLPFWSFSCFPVPKGKGGGPEEPRGAGRTAKLCPERSRTVVPQMEPAHTCSLLISSAVWPTPGKIQGSTCWLLEYFLATHTGDVQPQIFF